MRKNLHAIPNDSDEHRKAIALEAKYWDTYAIDIIPDYRLRRKERFPKHLWDDPQIDDIFRGEYISQIINPKGAAGLRILEIGCGTGWLSLELARNGHIVDACDISEKSISTANEYYLNAKQKENFNGTICYFIADLNNAKLPEDNYDMVVCFDSLHHVAQAERLSDEIHKTLHQGGKLLLFEHIGQKSLFVRFLNKLFISITLLMRPIHSTRELYCKTTDTLKRQRNANALFSPFEDITGEEMIKHIQNIFSNEKTKCKTAIAFGAQWIARIRAPKQIKSVIAMAMKRIDRWMIDRDFFKGEYVFIEATK